MDKSLIIILAVILFILMLLNNLNIGVNRVSMYNNVNQGSCTQTTFGCCPDGINSKINFYGTNCPKYNPGPGYPPPINKPVIITHR